MMRSSTTWVVRVYLLLGHVLFAGLVMLALLHWRERTMQVDNACQIFKWINATGLQIEAHRYSAIVPQLLVKAFASMGASLSFLLKLASLAHVLVPWTLYALIAHALNRPWIAIACALAAVLCTRLSFYGPVLEVNYLLSYSFLFAAVLEVMIERPSIWLRVASVLCLAAVVLVHPVGWMLALFVIAVLLVRVRERRSLWLMAALAGAWAVLGRSIFPPTGYEAGFYASLGEGIRSFFDGSPQPAFDFLVGHSWTYTTHYMTLWVLLAVLVISLARDRSWVLLALVLGSISGHVLLNAAVYHMGETAIMMEKNFLPLAVMVALPLCRQVQLQPDPWVRWSVVPFALVLFLQFRGISFASREVHARLVRLDELVEQARRQHIATGTIDAATCDRNGLHIHWALGYETLLLSATSGPDHAVLVLPTRDPQEGMVDPGTVPLAGHRILPEELDPRWFRLVEGKFHVLSVRPGQGGQGPWTEER